jgi:hypothetical protein
MAAQNVSGGKVNPIDWKEFKETAADLITAFLDVRYPGEIAEKPMCVLYVEKRGVSL